MILIIGIPNAGKTTYSGRYEDVVHFDDIWSRSIYQHLAEMISKNNEIVIEGVLGNAEKRKMLVSCSTARNVCIWLDTPMEECLERERNGRKRSEHLVIWSSEEFEPPTLSEGWDEIVIVRGNNEQRINREKHAGRSR